jgi:YegS/Rv2252/BmrU family lipid kinase
MSHILFIINPAGRGGMGMSVWNEFKSVWPDPIDSADVIVTERPGHAREIAATRIDYAILAVVGGNGALGEVMTGIMERQGLKPKVAIIPAGTGNDIARNLGIFSIDDAVDALQVEHARHVDLIRIDCRAGQKYAFLMGNVGFSANARIKPWMKRYLGPKAAYYLSTILQSMTYRAPHMTVRWEKQEYSGRVWMVIVANVDRVGGGGMCIAPGAQFDDGELNVSIIPSRSKFTMLTRMLPKAASGRFVNEPGVLYFPTKKIEVDSDPPVILDIDGDIFSMTPATIMVCPKAVQVITLE